MTQKRLSKKLIRARPTAVERNVHTTTATEFLQYLSPIADKWSDAPRDWIFRGVGDADRFTLVPAALRGPTIPSYTRNTPLKPRDHAEQVKAEYDLLWEFFRVANAQGLLIPEDSQIYRSPWASAEIHTRLKQAEEGKGPWPFDALTSMTALAQHHGVPTRLLDWSNDAFVAAYFAAIGGAEFYKRHTCGRCIKCGDKPDAGSMCSNCGIATTSVDPSTFRIAVWCLNWRYVWQRWPGDRANDIEILLVMAPRATNPNLHAQGGVFTAHIVKPGKGTAPIHRESLDKVIESTAQDIGIAFPVLRRITLPITQTGALLRLLAAHNIHAASIFPGFDGVVKHLKEWELWDDPPASGDLPIH